MFTLSIAMAARLFVVCFDLGAQAVRVRGWGWGRPIGIELDARGRSTTSLIAAATRRARPSSRAAARPHRLNIPIFSRPITISRRASESRIARLRLAGTSSSKRLEPACRATGGTMHIFTSITANYLPKAAALAHSVKRVHPEAVFHVVLCDEMPACPSVTTERLRQHHQHHATADRQSAVVDLQAPAGRALHGRRRGPRSSTSPTAWAPSGSTTSIPTSSCFRRLDGLERKLDRNSILLTPHLVEPETDRQAILDNEICCLRHGVYNLGFLAVRTTGQGRRFIDWWADRLRQFCYDEVPNGLFTDQRWVDLAPAFFDDIAIVREPEYNVATWNLTHRRATGTAPYEIQINDRPLVFYHFSGFDSGAQRSMLDRYGSHSPVLFDLREWYIARCEELGPVEPGRNPVYLQLVPERRADQRRAPAGLPPPRRPLRPTFRTRSKRAIRAARTTAGSSFTARPSGCGRWSSC